MEQERYTTRALTPEELTNLIGLLAMLKDGQFTVVRKSTIENDLSDWVCDHDFYD